MGELTIRRNRGFAPVQHQAAAKTEKQSAGSQSRSVSKATGFTVSETLRQLMSRTSQAENHSRESRRTLQRGEAVLAEVQEHLGRIAELARESAGEGEPDRAALQKELEHLQREIDRIIDSASAGEERLFLDGGADDGLEALLYAVMKESAAGPSGDQKLPDWLTSGISQGGLTPEQLLASLGLDKNASGADLMAAITGKPLGNGSSSDYLAALYLGAVIAGGSSEAADPSRAMDGLRQLLEKVAEGVSPDEAVKTLTGGEFTSLSDFQEQFTGGTAPGLEKFLVNLLVAGSDSPLLTIPSLMPVLVGLEDFNLDLMMDLLTASQNAQSSQAPGEAAPAEQPETSAAAAAGAEAPPSVQLGNALVSGPDLSGVSYQAASGELSVNGQADVTIRGTGVQAIVISGTGAVTLQSVRASVLAIETAEARVFSEGENIVDEVRLRTGASLSFGGGGRMVAGALHGGKSNVLRLTEGAVVLLGKDGKTLGNLTVPALMDGPASLAARSNLVRNPEGISLKPFDIIWKTLLPGFSSVASMTVDGRQAKMALLGGDTPTLARLWMDKGDPSHGSPLHALIIQGKDESGRPKTRYAYLLWNQQAGAFQEISMYPNPFTVTGGEPDQDWIYEEESHTLHILSNQVTAISGGTGTDANQAPFSGRISLADSIGTLELTLGGVVCRVSSGRAFHLGRENDVTLLLQSGACNFFESGAGCAGISLGEGTSLRIDRTGSRDDPDGVLTATGGSGGAGIGRDSGGGRDRTSRILIRGGVITAAGSGGGAGIGAGKRGFMGPLTITGGIITSTGGSGGGAGIGAALGAPVGDICIRGGAITATAVQHAAAIGAGVQGESGDILITGSARITKAQGGNPGADIGACLFGNCGKVLISGGADIGSARLWTRSGISLQMGEDTVTLPQFRLSSRALRLRKLRISTREAAQAAMVTVDVDRRWVAQIQAAYNTLYTQLTRSGFAGGPGPAGQSDDPVRDAGAAGVLLKDMGDSIPLPSSQALHTHSRRSKEDVRQLLR